jgi:hypothetical protein
MPLIYYWRGDNYRRDLDMGTGYHLNQANPLMHQIEIGDSLWAFTRTADGRYVLAAELVVRAKTLNPPNFRYGRYRIWGNLRRSRYFQVEGQPNIENIIRSLSCRTNASVLGQSFQGAAAVRPISLQDHQILSVYVKDLPLEPRARILPEEKLEAVLLLGDTESLANLLREEEPGIAEERREYLFRRAPIRNKQLVRELHELYDGKCQICLWDPKSKYGEYLCHGHHIHWLSRGGEDIKENLLLICPNHHTAIHHCDAPFDYQDSAFDFGEHSREPLQLNRHPLE